MAVFAGLSEKLNHIFSKMTKKGKLTELEIKQAMREVRIALLEADVNLGVAKDFINKVSEKAVAQMTDGVIVASPYKGTCEYCDYASVCKKKDVSERTVNKVDANIIVEAVNGDNAKDGD